MEWLIASDHTGIELKEKLLKSFQGGRDLGPSSKESVDYPDFAHGLALEISQAPNTLRGILICGSGIGMSIAANRHRGVRAALCPSVEYARLARQHNDANVLVLGARFMDFEQARAIVETFFQTTFEGGRHSTRIQKIECS